MAQPLPYMALKDAPQEIRRAATVAHIATGLARALSILFTTLIIATLPTWVPGILAYQTLPIALLVLSIGTIIVSHKSARIREELAERRFQKARGSSFTTAILGFIVGGILPGIILILLYVRIGDIMVKRTPDDPKTVFLLPHPSEGMFLGRYLGWIAAYLLVLYIGYTQLPAGLREVSDWLSPVLGVHFNTMIVALYLVFTNPLTYPPLLYLWTTAGFVGGLIAGGKVRRGFLVGMTAFISTLGALGLSALLIYQSINLQALASLPPPPPGFSIISATTGPVASDIIPILLQGSGPTSPATIQAIILTLIRNCGLVFATATISGRAASLFWQGDVLVFRTLWKSIKTKKPEITTPTDLPKKGILLLLISLSLLVPIHLATHQTSIIQAPPAGPYQQNLAVGLNMLGAPNASLRMTNLDLSSKGLVLDNNYANNNLSIFVINNNYTMTGNGASALGLPDFILGLFSQPALITFYTGDPAITSVESDSVATQFAQALGVSFIKAFAIPSGAGTVTIYAPSPELTNSDALARVLRILPSSSFSSLVTYTNLQNQKYLAAIGLATLNLPAPLNKSTRSFSFILNTQFPRQFYKAGQHYLSLQKLLGFQTGIVGDSNANASIISMSFQPGTILYSNLGYTPPFNPIWNNATSTYLYNATGTPAADFTANFTYPFAPDITIQKTAGPSTGPIGTIYNIMVEVQNLDNVTVTNLNMTDPGPPPAYQKTLQIQNNGAQTAQYANFPPGQTQSLSHTLTTESSGIYVLSQANTEFLWQAPNGTNIRYTITTDAPLISSSSGPWTQFTRTFTDFQPYSYLLLLPLILTPVVEVFRMMGRRKKNKPAPWMTPPPPAQSPPPSPPPTSAPTQPAAPPNPPGP